VSSVYGSISTGLIRFATTPGSIWWKFGSSSSNGIKVQFVEAAISSHESTQQYTTNLQRKVQNVSSVLSYTPQQVCNSSENRYDDSQRTSLRHFRGPELSWQLEWLTNSHRRHGRPITASWMQDDFAGSTTSMDNDNGHPRQSTTLSTTHRIIVFRHLPVIVIFMGPICAGYSEMFVTYLICPLPRQSIDLRYIVSANGRST